MSTQDIDFMSVIEGYFASFPLGSVETLLPRYFDAWRRSVLPTRQASRPVIELLPSFYADAMPHIRADAEVRARLLPSFNIFDAAGLGRDELRHCRLLAWLLDPNESHCQGPRLLSRLDEIARLGFPPRVILGAFRVRAEAPTTEGGRVDIEIVGPDFLLLIEAKIEAPDQPDQLPRHRRWADALARARGIAAEASRVAFLTPDDRPPTVEGVLHLTWRQVAEALAAFCEETDATGPDGEYFVRVLRDLAAHITEEMVP